MSFENSPSLEEFEDGIPQKLSDPSAKKKRLRTIIFGLLGVVILFVGVSFAQSNAANILVGKGTISGVALNDKKQPFNGYVFIIGTDLETTTNEDGSFIIENVPAGSRSLVIANETAGYEFPVDVVAGKNTNIGELKFTATATPDE